MLNSLLLDFKSCAPLNNLLTARDLKPNSLPLSFKILNLCYGFEQQQRSERASRNRNRNRIAACEYI